MDSIAEGISTARKLDIWWIAGLWPEHEEEDALRLEPVLTPTRTGDHVNGDVTHLSTEMDLGFYSGHL